MLLGYGESSKPIISQLLIPSGLMATNLRSVSDSLLILNITFELLNSTATVSLGLIKIVPSIKSTSFNK